jgi:putative oxidoreductase
MKENNVLNRGYAWLITAGNFFQSLILLVFRLYWGWQFFITGKGKLLDHEKIAGFFSSLHIPFPSVNAWFIGGLECFGGLLLIAGLCARPVGLLLTISMTVAYLTVADDRAKVLNIFHNPDKFLTADPFFFWLTAFLVFAFGPGLISVDALLKKFVFNNRLPENAVGTSNRSLVKDKVKA